MLLDVSPVNILILILKTVPLKYELGNETSIPYLSGRQSKLSAPRYCGPPNELLPSASGDSSSGAQHLGADSFDCLPERYEIDLYY